MDNHTIQRMFSEMGLGTEEQRRKFNCDLFSSRKEGPRHTVTEFEVHSNTLINHEHHA